MYRERLDSRDTFPSGMEDYLSQNGWHFNKRLCEWAVKQMKKKNQLNKIDKITPYTKDSLDSMLSANNVVIENNVGYDALYVLNMAKADYHGSSIVEDARLIKFVKDYLDDPDGYDGVAMTRFYADCIGKGIAIPWEDVL